MKLFHLADVHLDRPFVGMSHEAARQRRRQVRDTFERCLKLADDHAVDLITIGGDLWEEEHVLPDTRRWVADRLGRLNARVLMIGGNHDAFISGQSHARTDWPPNVSRFLSSNPQEQRFEQLSIWGASWTSERFSLAFLDTFRVPDDGRVHFLLVHGTSGAAAYLDEEGRYGPFESRAIEKAGFALCLAGHIHAAQRAGKVVYPGSPEPLRWSETHDHCVALVTVAGGPLTVELIPTNTHSYVDVTVDCGDAESSAAIEDALRAACADIANSAPRTYLTAYLVGEVSPECEVDADALAARHPEFAGVRVINNTRFAYDFEALAQRPTALGRFVTDLRARIEAAAGEDERGDLELALLAGVRAMDGQKDVLDVG